MRIVVLGYIVRCPIGGMAWHHLQYVLGLSRLGHDVTFVEDSGDHAMACYDPSRHVTDPDPAYGLDFADATFTRIGMPDCWAYHDALQGRWHGPAADRAIEAFHTADMVLNVSGSNVLRPWALDVQRRVFIDTDPAFTQLRHIVAPERRDAALTHTHHFSFGENFGHASCLIPDDGFEWRPTRQPIVLDAWPETSAPCDERLTTVMAWDDDSTLQKVPLEHDGRAFGRKSRSFEPYFELPTASPRPLELAIGGKTVPRVKLEACGWRLRDALEVTVDPWSYQRYIQGSMAEFGIAKEAYVTTNSGWFSERSACYLASGRPVVVQDTAFASWLAADYGVLRFGNRDEAAARLDHLVANYPRHTEAAREVAADYFAAERVLGSLIERIVAT